MKNTSGTTTGRKGKYYFVITKARCLRKVQVFARASTIDGTSTVCFRVSTWDMKRTIYSIYIYIYVGRRNQRWLTGEYERSIDFASGIAPVLFCDADHYVSIMDLDRPTFRRKLTSSINNRAKATSVITLTRGCLLSNKKKNISQIRISLSKTGKFYTRRFSTCA